MMNERYTLHNGDCLAVLASMADCSVDSIVCDPPYELGFMGKAWDKSGIANNVSMWREALRVLKPGGHLLAFSGSRTYHRMACAIEDAGFELRDQIMWVYATGFPKSLDVSKAIDKARTEDAEPVRVICRAVRAAMDARGLKSRDLVQHFGNCNPRLIDHWAARDTDSQPSLPTTQQWATLRDVLGMGDALDEEVARLNGRKGTAGDTWANAEIVGEHQGATPGFGEHRFNVVDKTIREPSSAARDWAGWGTALKPAHEPICVARKPLRGTVAANVLAHGTGALNIDGCRVGDEVRSEPFRSLAACGGNAFGAPGTAEARRNLPIERKEHVGRWPANLLHDGSPEVLALFPESKGQRGAVTGNEPSSETNNVYGQFNGRPATAPRVDLDTSAARFFYCAKASPADRHEGLAHPGAQFKQGTTLRNVQVAAEAGELSGNTHPTVKPTSLMQWLCRLVTPPGGTVLDPFMGSGSTGKAAMREGFRFIGIELDAAYLAIADARIKFELLKQEPAPEPEAPPADVRQLDLLSHLSGF